MKDKVIDILWGIFAFTLGGFFILGGIDNIFSEKAVTHKQYNELYPILVGLFSIGIGSLIIYSWFKQRSKSKVVKQNRSKMDFQIKIAWSLVIFSALIFLSSLVRNDIIMFQNFLPALKSQNFKWMFLAFIENLGINLYAIIGSIIGSIHYRKHREGNSLNTVKVSIFLIILTFLFY